MIRGSTLEEVSLIESPEAAIVDINSKIRKTPVENVKKHREKLWTNI